MKLIMNITLLWQHRSLLLTFLICFITPFVLSFNFGVNKAVMAYKWTDIVGEGSVALLTVFWILAAMASRPPGKVTLLLVLGLNCFMFSGLLDVLDEFVRYPPGHEFISVIESIPAAIGMVIMSVALYLWHLEQLALNRQLQRRELQYRSFEQIDFITQLYTAEYWRERTLELQKRGITAAIVVLDVNNFTQFNIKFGNVEGDRLLRELAHLILMNLRPNDLACRYAGDRFVILLPDADAQFAADLAIQIENSIKNVAYRANEQTAASYQSVRTEQSLLHPDADLSLLLRQLNMQLDNNTESASCVALDNQVA